MTVSNAAVLKGFYNATKALGTKSVSSDSWFEVAGHEDLALLTKQFPWPVMTSMGEIEVSTPLGGVMWEQQQLRVAHQGPITFTETIAGRLSAFMRTVHQSGGKFNATVYEGSPDKFTRAAKIVDAFVVLDQADRDWENRSQLLLINGTLHFHFFDEWIAGNDVAR